MANLQFTRINKIFSSKESAIERLDQLSRTYAEGVVVKYLSYDGVNSIENLIFAIYKSDTKGDYTIIYDSSSPASTSGFRVFTVKKTSEDQTDSEAINVALFGEDPKNYDIAIITSFDGNSVYSYIYYEGSWNYLAVGGGGSSTNLNISATDTDTIDLTLETNPSISTEKILKADVKIDNQSLVFDEEAGGIRVNKIYGGTF